MGLLAQEVRQAFPEFVHEDSEGHLSVAYGNFTAVLLEAVKEQQQELSVVKAENQELRAMINELSVALERLELLTSGIEH